MRRRCGPLRRSGRRCSGGDAPAHGAGGTGGLAAAPGVAAPGTVRALRWFGTARVRAGGREVVIGVRTRVEPLVRARSETWLVHRRETARTLVVEPDGAWTVRGGLWTRMPEAFAAHERAQYALWGLAGGSRRRCGREDAGRRGGGVGAGGAGDAAGDGGRGACVGGEPRAGRGRRRGGAAV
jgi:hypothetical protein